MAGFFYNHLKKSETDFLNLCGTIGFNDHAVDSGLSVRHVEYHVLRADALTDYFLSE